ncbi:MAG: 1-deoxy-D-xylulose-5-phosphate reductoisomerase [bacterium Ellin6529]|nr:1-deoxy-D-xylulose-5-phosphate reductoisomerase [bacterium Ellin6529]
MGRQRVAIIGATGSIGAQTLQVLRDAPDRFELVAYAVGRESAAVQELAAAHPGAQRLVGLSGVELSDAILGAAPDLVVAAATGLVGIHATINALHAGAAVAIANKETIVAGGELVIGAARSAAARRGTAILERLRPVDSEHSALWQCLAGESVDRVERFWLTASGGPFRTWDASRIANARFEDALKHPTWKMGGKITIDSASLVNKGLEVIEAHRLFEAPMDRISIMVHPQSLLHGAISFTDGSMKAQIGAPDMRVPISYAMNYPQRSEQPARAVSLADMRELTFEEPDLQRFPGLAVALAAGEAGGAAPATLIVADDIATTRFAAGEIPFGGIPGLLRDACDRFGGRAAPASVEALSSLRDEVQAFAVQWRPS